MAQLINRDNESWGLPMYIYVAKCVQPVLARSLHASQSNGSHSARLALALMLLTILFADTESSQRLSRCSIFEYLNAVV